MSCFIHFSKKFPIHPTLSQLLQLNATYTQLLSSITAQQQHLKLLIHILQTNGAEISNSFIEEAINGFILSYQNLSSLINNATDSNAETNIGILQTKNSNVETNLEILQATDSNAETNIGILQTTYSNVGTNIATKQMLHSNTETSIPPKQVNDINIDTAKLNTGILQTKIKKYIITCSEKTAQAAATIIIALYKNPKQTHSNLIKLTGLSIGGLAKHIMMLKKRGLIVKTAYQQFEPTSLSLQMMGECCV